MSNRLFQRAGEALYGPRWQSEMARELNVSERTIRNWLSGAADVPRGVYADIFRLVVERAAELDDLEQQIKERA